MLPVWGWGPTIGEGHMDPMRAAGRRRCLRPRLAIPIHWGTFYPAGLRRVHPRPFEDPGRQFAAAVAQRARGQRARPGAGPVAPARTSPLVTPVNATNPAVAGGARVERRGRASAERDVGDDPERREDEHEDQEVVGSNT